MRWSRTWGTYLNAVEFVIITSDVGLVERDLVYRAMLIDVDPVGGFERTIFIDQTSKALSPHLLFLKLLARGHFFENR